MTAEATATPGPAAAEKGEHVSDAHQSLDEQVEVVSYERSPLDVLRLLGYASGAVVVVLVTKYLRHGFDGIEIDLTSLAEVPWAWLRRTVEVLLIASVVLAGLVVLVLPLVTRRFRLFGYVVVANVLAAITFAVIAAWVGGLDPPVVVVGASAEQIARNVGADVLTTMQLVAAFVAISSFVSQRWRLAGMWLVGIVIALRILVTTAASTHSLMVLTVGATIGTAVLLAFGRPTTRPRESAILDSLRAGGLPVATLAPATVDARGSLPYFATLDDGRPLFIKVLGTDQRAADLLFRLYRFVHLKNVGDERPFSSLRRTVEHEALVALQARDVGVRTPRLRCVAPVGRDSFLLAYELIQGGALLDLADERLTDELLDRLWRQAAVLRHYRIAHRDLRLANVIVDDDDEPWLIDFGFSEIAAADGLLCADVAQLIAATAIRVGAERAVSPAVRAMGPEAVGASLGRLQLPALSGSTQTQLHHQKGLLGEVREEVQRQCEVTEPAMEPVTRIGGKQVFTLVMLTAVVYFLIPQLTDLPGILTQIQNATWGWVVPMLVASAATYPAAALALIGSVPGTIAPLPTAAAQVAGSFASKVAPAGLGGMALNVRFLQKQGVDGAVATSAVGLDTMAGLVGHLSLVAVFVVWAGRDAFGDVHLPSPQALVIGTAVVVVLAIIVMAIPASRRLVIGKLFPILMRSVAGLRVVLTSPSKLVYLLGGSVLLTGSYTVAFYFSCRAFGIDDRFATLAAVYLVGAAIATVAPTPGGLGATEAALIGGMVAIGVSKDLAVPAVFLFRLGTFWLPVLPGWAAFTWLRRTDRL